MGLVLLGVLLCIGAGAAEHATAFKDKAKETRAFRAELVYRLDGVLASADGKPQQAGMVIDLRWDAREKVLSAERGAAALSYELIKGTEKGQAMGALAAASPEDALYEEKMDPLAVSYRRGASGAASEIKCTEGELPFLDDDEEELLGALNPFFALAYPFGHGLVFPAATGQDGDAWTEELAVKLPAPSPEGTFAVGVNKRYVIDGARQVDGRKLLQVTCTVAGKRGPGLQEWEMEEGEMMAAIVGAVVDGTVTYLFDPAAGALHRVTARLSVTLEIKQEGRNAKLTESLNTRLERVKK
jgi:hypothetical protein